MSFKSNKYKDTEGNRKRYLELRRKQKQRWRKNTDSGKYVKSAYTIEEEQMILDHEISDRELSKIIHRSVQAIQVKRSRLKNGR